MSAVRIEVEHGFGIVANLWPFLNAGWKMQLYSSPVGRYYRVALAGIVLQKSFFVPDSSATQLSHWTVPTSDVLFAEIDCLWNIYTSLNDLGSVGLPLQPSQAKTDGQLVTLVQACKPIAEGEIIGHHDGYLHFTMDAEGHTK
ncbi:hypothetical protein B0H10DRAFT_1887659, partial [Mycena sp. CBHHK59/15]